MLCGLIFPYTQNEQSIKKKPDLFYYFALRTTNVIIQASKE